VRRALLTGATGFIGSEFLRRLVTWSPDVEPIILVRPRGRQRAEARVDALWRDLFGIAADARRLAVRVVEGDLISERLGLDDATYEDLAASVTEIWHFGADVRFDQPVEMARQIHVAGTLHLATLAHHAVGYGQFTRFHHISTYATARRDNATRFSESPPVLTSRFRNTYEQTKAEGEAALLARAGSIPVTIARIGIVVGDSRTGWTPKFDVFYFPIRLLLEEMNDSLGRMRIPVLGTARSNAVAVDDVVDALYVLGQRPRGPSGEILHLVPGTRAPLVATAITIGMKLFVESRARRGQAPPQLPEIAALPDVSPGSFAQVLGEEMPPEVLEMVMQVMPYAFDAAVWENDRLVEALAGSGIECRPIDTVLGPIVDYPVRTAWGSIPEGRPPLGQPPV
jgi:thioester reductase-like protein